VGEAGLTGLVHDIGAAALLQHIAENERAFAHLVAEPEAVGHVLQELHPLAGERLARHWRVMPEIVIEIMRDHHAPSPASSMHLLLVAAANDLATRAGAGSGFGVEGTALAELVGGLQTAGRLVDEFRRTVVELSP
jgi:HD-like signal output (HDOD) protein